MRKWSIYESFLNWTRIPSELFATLCLTDICMICVYVRACVRACVRARARARVCVCICVSYIIAYRECRYENWSLKRMKRKKNRILLFISYSTSVAFINSYTVSYKRHREIVRQRWNKLCKHYDSPDTLRLNAFARDRNRASEIVKGPFSRNWLSLLRLAQRTYG